VLCDHCPALAVVFRLGADDPWTPVLCFCMACAVRDGWPWGVVTETPARRKSR
jgi:hypothetical protein